MRLSSCASVLLLLAPVLGVSRLACAEPQPLAAQAAIRQPPAGSQTTSVQFVSPAGPGEQAFRYCPEQVYIFAINGIDPWCLGKFDGLCKQLKDQGFTNTYFTQFYADHGFAQKIRGIRAQNPQARIVLMGFSMGCNYARALANRLGDDGIHVDLMVYVAGDCIRNVPTSCPGNVGQVLNIRSHGLILAGGDLIWNGAELDGATNRRINTRHMLTPGHPQTFQWIMEELSAVAHVR